MLVDPVTVAAQIVNFLVLVYLLHRFLYGPIIETMADRRRQIEEQVAAAERTKAEAQEQIRRYEEMRREQEAQREDLLAKARDDAESWADELREEARAEVDRLKERWTSALVREQETFWREFEEELGGELETLACEVLRELAGTDLAAQVQRSFFEHLKELPEAEAARLAELSAGQQGLEVKVLSAAELDESCRADLETHLGRLLGGPAELEFEVRPELVAGIEVRGSGWKMGWSIRGYVQGLGDRLRAYLEERSGGDTEASGDSAAPETKPEEAGV